MSQAPETDSRIQHLETQFQRITQEQEDHQDEFESKMKSIMSDLNLKLDCEIFDEET